VCVIQDVMSARSSGLCVEVVPGWACARRAVSEFGLGSVWACGCFALRSINQSINPINQSNQSTNSINQQDPLAELLAGAEIIESERVNQAKNAVYPVVSDSVIPFAHWWIDRWVDGWHGMDGSSID
jgi:hypothetical protein